MLYSMAIMRSGNSLQFSFVGDTWAALAFSNA
uniref:Uncharacterized protein n=1 Tax=Arundo donax TaxID=35708 RepID=A0A0A8ZQQ2_ARUDO